ncbi:hypothetical protein [Streptacidiphilus cavernicola]|uniref:Histidine kinase n=1 Tax=Streptacidiphilus cavernicola TaxID=3342716 RepID=A0ABV6W4N9_9ACTN
MSGTQLLFRTVGRRGRVLPASAPVTPAAPAARAGLVAPMALVAAFAVAAPVSVLLAATGERPHPTVVLVVLTMAAFGVGLAAADLLGGVAIGLVCWLFLDGFDADRWGVLGWDGHADAVRLGVLVAAGMLGALARCLRVRYLSSRQLGSRPLRSADPLRRG